MKITFGKIPEEFKNQDKAFTGTDSDGNPAEFYYTLDIKEESNNIGMFKISDTCNRYMPFDFEQLDELYEVINLLKTYRDDKIKFENHWQTTWGLMSNIPTHKK